MKKSTGVLTLVVALAAAYTGASWYVGTKTENAIRAQINTANEYLRAQTQFEQLKIELASYNRSIFSATASYVLSLRAQGEQETYEFILNDTIAHGPIPFAAGSYVPAMAVSHLELQKNATVEDWFEFTDGKTPVYADTTISWSGKADSTVEFLGFKKAQEEFTMDFSGGQFITELDSSAKSYTGKFNFDHFILDSIEDEPFQMTLNKLYGDFSYTGQLYVDDKQLGKVVLEKAEINAEKANLSLHGLEVTGNSATINEMLSGQARYAVKSIKVSDQDIGNLEIGVALSNWYAPAVKNITDVLNQLSADPDLDNLSEAERQQLLNDLHALLERKPSITIAPVLWANSAGKTDFGLEVKLQAPSTKQADLVDVMAWNEALEEAQLTVQISRPMLEQVINAMAQTDEEFDLPAVMEALDQVFEAASGLEAMGLVKMTDDGMESRIIYRGAEGGTLNINGVPVPMSDLLMMGMGLLM
ncbi:YdgA family protein [Alcaligenes endophyticus]|uniref:YdgA family protein n=1 Tax=Alcaligenes endophyticus TaxID=1929088 RepID=A0ABT8EHX0_9BURK|nr:YdgA family protein [Alcaligenes endophyticus]MCX5592695.1 YdgA family protein [Alcaligenes endophyticus]MDN4120883.1 YdgA family protein [Alcaligenes endophyticus]